MSKGKAVIVTQVGGSTEMIGENRNGLLVPPGDASALGAALTRFFEDPRLRQGIGCAGSLSVLPRFGIDRYVASITSLYDTLLERVA